MLIEDGRLSEMLSEYGEQIVMTGDGAEEFSEKFGNGCIKLSPCLLYTSAEERLSEKENSVAP